MAKGFGEETLGVIMNRATDYVRYVEEGMDRHAAWQIATQKFPLSGTMDTRADNLDAVISIMNLGEQSLYIIAQWQRHFQCFQSVKQTLEETEAFCVVHMAETAFARQTRPLTAEDISVLHTLATNRPGIPIIFCEQTAHQITSSGIDVYRWANGFSFEPMSPPQ